MAEKNVGLIKELEKRQEKLTAKAKHHDGLRAKYEDAAASVQKAIDSLKTEA